MLLQHCRTSSQWLSTLVLLMGLAACSEGSPDSIENNAEETAGAVEADLSMEEVDGAGSDMSVDPAAVASTTPGEGVPFESIGD